MIKNILVFLAATLIGGLVTLSQMSYAEDAPEGGMPQAMPASVATVSKQEITEWKEFSGRLRAVEDVQIRPRVSGTIDEVHFSEGDVVEKGARLFTIDLRPYKAAAAQAEAALASAKAQADLAATDFKRAKGLLADKALSQREFEEKENEHKDAAAAVKSAQAKLDLANLDLEYAEVKAPITGRVGRPDITVGNTVQAGSVVLTTMQSISPVYADFDIDEQTYLRLVKSVRAENKAQDMPVFMALADETEATRAGKIRSFDNQLVAESGTMRVRAEFENADGILTPGLFARIRLGSADKKNVVVINDAAIGTDQSKRFVYTVDSEGNVGYRPVTLGERNGQMRVIENGLNEGEMIVVNGLMRVHPGMKVMPMPVMMETLQPLSPPPSADPAVAPTPETPAAPAGH